MTVGVIDVGSNSVRLLVATRRDGRFFCVHHEKATTRLLAGCHDGLLEAGAIARTAEAVDRFADTARGLGAETIVAFGTSAMRDGQNSDLLIDAARAHGVNLAILSGEEEARMAYLGAAPNGRSLVIDIGGGSTELLAGDAWAGDAGAGDAVAVRASYSARIGAVRLTEATGGDGDPARLVRAATDALSPAWAAVSACPVDACVGVGGTITTIAAVSLGLKTYDRERVEGCPVDATFVRALLRRLCPLSVAERRAIPGVEASRADILPAGCAILEAFFNLSGLDTLRASSRDNLLGFCAAYFTK